MKEIIKAESAGFCFGVERAVDMVREELEKGEGKIYTYGPIIHNESVVKDFADKGVEIIDKPSDLDGKERGTVIIRCHGVAENIYKELESKNVKIADSTCPFVLKIHRIVEEKSKEGKQIVIIGNESHPEVQGIIGWCSSKAIVVDDEEKAYGFESDNKDLHIVSQTTFQSEKFTHLVEIIKQKGYNVDISNTICNATEVRQKEAFRIAGKVDAMIVIGGSNSSNTRKLYDISKRECQETFLIQDVNDLDLERLKSAKRIGITAGASTPNNIIQEVYTSVRAKF